MKADHPLEAWLTAELSRRLPPEIGELAGRLARMGEGAVEAVFFYGSALRTGALDGVLDFYVLVDDLRCWPQGRFAALAGALVPPNVEYREFEVGGVRLRAKVAILRADQFGRHAGRASLDTTIWARFAQPAALAWYRDVRARDAATGAVAEAVRTAAYWAAVLGPDEGVAREFWDSLFRETYAAELRVDWRGRPETIVDAATERYGGLLPLAWRGAGVDFEERGGTLRPGLTLADRRRARRAWRRRRRLGKPLTALRLAKAVFTFAGSADYAAWKIERHTGVKIELTPWRRRHPLLAAPGVAWRLWRAGVLK